MICHPLRNPIRPARDLATAAEAQANAEQDRRGQHQRGQGDLR
ncbi:hypothetical protein LCGC14_1167610, partial [marine sediment metagenome]